MLKALAPDENENSGKERQHASDDADAESGKRYYSHRDQIDREQKHSDIFGNHAAIVSDRTSAWQVLKTFGRLCPLAKFVNRRWVSRRYNEFYCRQSGARARADRARDSEGRAHSGGRRTCRDHENASGRESASGYRGRTDFIWRKSRAGSASENPGTTIQPPLALRRPSPEK